MLDGREPAETFRLPVALSKPLVAIVSLPQDGGTRALKKPVRPRLGTEQGKGFAFGSGRITAAGGSGLSRTAQCKTLIFGNL